MCPGKSGARATGIELVIKNRFRAGGRAKFPWPCPARSRPAVRYCSLISMANSLVGAVVGLVAVVIIVLLFQMRRRRTISGPGGGSPVSAPDRHRTCPLCGGPLIPGERVSTTIRLSPTGRRIMEITGCPQCRPPSSRIRRCPVCKTSLGQEDVVTARTSGFSQGDVKPHVHVLGCTKCLGGR